MAFKLVHAKYDRESERAYVELRDEDDDGGEIEILAVSFRTTARLSKQQIEQDIVRKARHILKRAAASTSASPAPRSAPHQPGHGASAAAGRSVRHVSRSSNCGSPSPASVQNTGASRCCGNKVKPSPRPSMSCSWVRLRARARLVPSISRPLAWDRLSKAWLESGVGEVGAVEPGISQIGA